MKKQRSASPSQAMPEVGALAAHLVDDEAAVLLEQRVGLVVGELAVRLPVGPAPARSGSGRAAAPPSARPCRCRRRARPSGGRSASASMYSSAAPRNGSLTSSRVHRAARGRPGGRARPRPRGRAARRCRSRPTARARRAARASRRCTPSGLCEAVHIRPPSRSARADGPVDHLRARHADVEHVHALVDEALVRSGRPWPARTAACRARAPRAARSTGLPSSSPSTRAKARPIR